MGTLRISFRRSGGIAGIDLTAETTIDELPHDQAETAAQLWADPHIVGSANAVPPVPDQLSYELHLDDGTTQRHFDWPAPQLPEALRPLIDTLNRQARPGPG